MAANSAVCCRTATLSTTRVAQLAVDSALARLGATPESRVRLTAQCSVGDSSATGETTCVAPSRRSVGHSHSERSEDDGCADCAMAAGCSSSGTRIISSALASGVAAASGHGVRGQPHRTARHDPLSTPLTRSKISVDFPLVSARRL